MKSVVCFVGVIACIAALGEGVAPLVEIERIESKEAEVPGWFKQVVMATPDGNVVDKSGVVVSIAETEAVRKASDEVSQISDAARAVVVGARAELLEHTDDMAKHSKSYYLTLAPEGARPNLTGFVVKEESTGRTDTQWVWYNKSLSMKPVRWVEYQGDYVTNSVKATWVNWSKDGETVVVDGKTWSGCHKCTVERPVWAYDVPCLTKQNETVGGESGFNIGDANILLDGEVPFTGYTTNRVENLVEYYNNGVLMERTSL